VELEHSFSVPVGVEEAWRVLLDIERIAPCMPGAAVESVDGDEFTGTVKVKLGPIGLTYKGKASFVEKDPAAHRAVIDARGRDARGNGTANATITAILTEVDGATRVAVRTTLDITGKPAQFGRGVMVDVGTKLIGQFAGCLATKLTAGVVDLPAATETVDGSAASSGNGRGSGSPADAAPTATTPRAGAPAAGVEPINLVQSAGPAIAKRVAALLAAVAVVLLILRRRRRCRR
jgi:carbon monoxide dehydrogenase subunit G